MDQNNTTPNNNLGQVQEPKKVNAPFIILLVLLTLAVLGMVAYLKFNPDNTGALKQEADAIIKDSETKVEEMDKNEFDQNLDQVTESEQDSVNTTESTNDLDAQINSLNNMDLDVDDSSLNDTSLNDLTN